MDLKDIKELIALMRKNDLSVFKLEQESFKITLKRGVDLPPAVTTAITPIALPLAPAPTPSALLSEGLQSPNSKAPASPLKEIVSPMVGTFYSAASPESPAYVSVGQEVTEDTVVCIIEAMKVMNEIKAEVRGTIVELVAENGKPVQFGQPLFRLK